MQNYAFYLSLFLLTSFWLSPKGFAQDAQTMHIEWMDSAAHGAELAKLESSLYRHATSDSSLLAALHDKSYWTASVDSLAITAQARKFYVYLGPRFVISSLTYPGPEQHREISRAFTSKKGLSAKARIEKTGIQHLQNTGYPFASWSWHPVAIDSNQIALHATVKKGPYIQYDSVIIDPDLISPDYLALLTGQQPGTPYHEQRFKYSSLLIGRLPFVELSSPPQVAFDGNGATISYRLKPRKINRFEFFLGLLPNAGEEGGTLVTGEMHLELYNLAKAGRYLAIDWQHVKERSPRLDFAYKHPFLFKTPFRWELAAQLLKEDSLFVNRNLNLAIVRETYSGLSYGLKGTLRGSNVLSTPAASRENESLSNAGYGVGAVFGWQGLKDPLFARDGLRASLEASLGSRQIGEGVSTADSLESPYSFTEVALDAVWNFSTGRSSGLSLRATAYGLDAEVLFINDLRRFGGLRSVRGFNQNEFFASHAAVVSAEYRVFPEEQSVVYLFIDAGKMRYSLSNGDRWEDTVLGLGIGMTLKTQAGALTINWAVGKSREQSMDLRQSKIHFGYTARF